MYRFAVIVESVVSGLCEVWSGSHLASVCSAVCVAECWFVVVAWSHFEQEERVDRRVGVGLQVVGGLREIGEYVRLSGSWYVGRFGLWDGGVTVVLLGWDTV